MVLVPPSANERPRMPSVTQARKICSQPHCPNLQPCPVPGHTRKAWEGSTRSKRLPPGWDRIRRRILDRDPICKVCDAALSTICDHIEPGDDHRDENLQGICDGCHKVKTQRESAAARASM